jgi:hypothetical protein
LPDFGEWELKSQRAKTSSLLTLFHVEPEPRSARIVPQILLLDYGWPHQEAGLTYPANERSFRQTIKAISCSDRGFKVNVDYQHERVYISFDYSQIDNRHKEWRSFIRNGVGTGDISPNPFWSFDTLTDKLENKINNLLYFRAEQKQENGKEYFKYNELEAFIDPDLESFLSLIEEGVLYVDFDARTGHNHGTKFRLLPSRKTDLYHTQLEA